MNASLVIGHVAVRNNLKKVPVDPDSIRVNN